MEPFTDLTEFAAKWALATEKSNHQPAEGPLFGGVTDDVIIPMVGEALRAVIGNERLRYYSLRYAFASWTMTHLLLSELQGIEIPDLFSHLPATTL